VAPVRTDVSEEHIASISLSKIGEQGKTIVINASSHRVLDAANVIPN
jgi:hypothetical protein